VGLDGANDDDIPATPSIARWGQDDPLRPAFKAASFIRGSEHTAFPADTCRAPSMTTLSHLSSSTLQDWTERGRLSTRKYTTARGD
jgi:hypothetical protein